MARTRTILATLLALAPAALARQQGTTSAPSFPAGGGWPAPTAEDWKRPVLVKFQRTWEDAQALAKETKRPILVCINMDGEPASEHYAGVRYRQPEIAVLYEPYVCVIASVYRHAPRDFDEQGNRILCPRFGSCTCGEHIAIEPLLYEKFMDGRRIAPRHIMVELDGSEVFDVMLAPDTGTVFLTIDSGIRQRTIVPTNVARGDRPLLERVASPDNEDKSVVEKAYLQGDAALRKAVLEQALARGEAVPVDLLRLAVFGNDPDLARLARRALVNARADGAVDLIAEALRVPLEADEREPLLAALERLGEGSAKARTLVVVHRGLGNRSQMVDVEAWKKAFASAATYEPAPDRAEVEARVDGRARAAASRPADATARLELAESLLALALEPKTQEALAANPKTARRYEQLMFEDARRAALDAERCGAKGWRLDTVLAVAAQRLGDLAEAEKRAEAAVAGMAPDAKSAASASVLQLFAESRQKAISKAVVAKEKWPPQWMADVHSAYAVLGRHPLGTDVNVVSHYDFVLFLGGKAQAGSVLEEGLLRFPNSWLLHDRLRAKILAEKGASGLEPAYEAMLAKPGAATDLEWFAGYTSLVAAEFLRRERKPAEATSAYGRAVAHYDKSVAANPSARGSADWYAALAIAGRARVALEGGRLDDALADIVAALERGPEAAAVLDGLNISPVDTAKLLRTRLQEAKHEDRVARLDAALAKLDPSQLAPPAYERGLPPPGGAQSRPGRRGRGR